MKNPRRNLGVIAVFGLAAAFLLVPQFAHANFADDLASGAVDVVFNILLAIADLFHSVLIWAIGVVGGWIQGLIEMDPSGGGAVIYTSWRILRDICNMAFIVALILMAFGTIFDSLNIGWLKAYSIHGRGVIVNFLMAAILLNLSLAIGQAVVATSNQASSLIVGFLPDNLGPRIAQQVDIARVATKNDLLSAPAPAAADNNALSPSQFLEVRRWTAEKRERFQRCLDGTMQPDEIRSSFVKAADLSIPARCYEGVKSDIDLEEGLSAETNRVMRQAAFGATGGTIGVAIANVWTFAEYAGGAVGSWLKGEGVYGRLGELFATIFSSVLLVSLLLDFLVVVLFLLIRIPMIWVLLALSPLAWTSLAFPGLKAMGYDRWWKQFWAWNLFSPLFLGVLYLGMVLLKNVNTAVASLGAQDSLFLASLGIMFQYFIAAIVLIGGTALVLKSSFLVGTTAGEWVGRITGGLGVGGPGGAFAPIGRFTGVTPAVRGAVGGVTGAYERLVTRPAARREEEIEARYRARFGDTRAYEALQRKRIQEESKKLEEAGMSIADRKARLLTAKEGSSEYFALAQSLLKDGELSPQQMQDLVANAGKYGLGPVAQNALREQVAKKLAERAREKKFKDDRAGTPGAKTAAEKAKDAFSAIAEEKDREKFLQDLKKNQLSVYAQLAGDTEVKNFMAGQKMDDAGKLAPDIIEDNISKLDADDVPAVMKAAAANGWTLGPAFHYSRDLLLNDKNNIRKMLGAADATGRAEIMARIDELKRESQQAEAQRAQVTAEAGVLAQERLEAEREDRDRALRTRGAGPLPPPPPPRGGGPAPAPPPAGGAVRPSPRASTATPRPGAPGTKEYLVAIDGTARGSVVVPAGASDGDLRRAALANPQLEPYLRGKRMSTVLLGDVFNIRTSGGISAPKIRSVPVYVDGQLRATLGVRESLSDTEVTDIAKAHPDVAPWLRGKNVRIAYSAGHDMNISTT